MKKGLAAILVLLLITIGAGCWNRRELDTLAVVQGVGIDRAKEDGKISLTAQILKPAEVKPPSGGQGSSKGVWTLSTTGYTVFDAFRNATMQANRKLYLPFVEAIVIGEEMARSGVAPLIDFFARDHETRRLSLFLIAKGEAKDILEAEHEQERIPAAAIEGLVRASSATSMAAEVDLHEFMKMLASKTTDPVASRIEIIAAKELEKKAKESAQGEKGKEGSPKKRVRVTGAAVFQKDKLVGWLNRPETRGLNWILGKVKSGIIVVKSPKDENQYAALEITSASSKITPEIRNGRVHITVKVEAEGNLGEEMSDVDPTRLEIWESLQRRQAEVIRNEMEAVLAKAQKEWRVDIFGFGEAVHRKYPKEWKKLEKRWREELPKVEVKLEVNAKLRKMGLITAPVKVEQ